MQEFWTNFNEASFYGAVWLAAVMGSLCRALYSRDLKHFRIILGGCGIAGIVGCAVVAFMASGSNSVASGWWFYIWLSGTIGVAGAEVQRWLIMLIFRNQGLPDGPDKQNE